MEYSDGKKHIISETFIDILNDGRTVEIPVYGLSMFPLYLPGDTVRVKYKNISNLISGDVVVFKVGNKLIMHRLLNVNLTKNQLLCKGDGLIFKDPIVNFTDYLGVVIAHYRRSRLLKPSKRLNKLLLKTANYVGVIFFAVGRLWNKLYYSRRK